MSATPFLTLHAVAERWSCGLKVVRAAIDRGDLRVHRFSRKCVRVSLADVERCEARSTGARSRDRHAEGAKHGGTT